MVNVTRIERIQEHAMWTKAGPVVSHLPDDEVSALEEQAAATIGDPSTLGLWSFATGTWMVGTVLGGAFPATAVTGVVPALLVFAGLAQFIAGLFAFRRANSVAGTAFCCFGAFNVAAAFTFLMQANMMLPAAGNARILLGFLLESFAFIALALTIAAMRMNMAIVAVLALLCIGYALAGIPDLADDATGGLGVVGNIGGWFLVASAAFAYYAGMAMVVNSGWKRQILPMGGQP